MIIRKITIEFTDDPSEIDNFGEGTYKNLPNGDKVVRAYCQDDSDKWKIYSFLCAMHELTEFYLTEHHCIAEQLISDFDAWFEAQGFNPDDEPGDHILSPYHKEHRSSEMVEMYLAERFGIDWRKYLKEYVIPKDFKYNENYGKENNI